MCILFGKIFQHFWIFLCINLTNPTLVYLLTFGGNAPFLGHNKSFIIVPSSMHCSLGLFETAWHYLTQKLCSAKKCVPQKNPGIFSNSLNLETNTESQFPLFWALLDIKWATSCQWHGGVRSLFRGTLSKTKWTMCWKTREHLNGLGKTGGCRGCICICCHQETFLFVLPQIHRK